MISVHSLISTSYAAFTAKHIGRLHMEVAKTIIKHRDEYTLGARDNGYFSRQVRNVPLWVVARECGREECTHSRIRGRQCRILSVIQFVLVGM